MAEVSTCRPISLSALPNELLLHIFASLSTSQLLPFSSISQRVHDLILRIFEHRLTVAAPVHDHNLLLECYHPSARLTEPPLHCAYLGTEGLDSYTNLTEDDQAAGPGHKFKKLNGLYSCFRPYRRQIERSSRRHPAGDIPGSRTHPSSAPTPGPAPPSTPPQPGVSPLRDPENLVTQHVHLDAGELFTQLCATTTIVKTGPKNGVYYSSVPVSDGIIRIWRNWLAEQSRSCDRDRQEPGLRGRLALADQPTDVDVDRKGKEKEIAGFEPGFQSVNEQGVLWVNDGKNVGLRFRVRERKWRRENPVLFQRDEEVAVSYEIQYEELLVRTRHLLLATEKALLEQQNVSGKALVFGVWETR